MGSKSVKYTKSNEEIIESLIKKGFNISSICKEYNIRQIFDLVVQPVNDY